MKKILLVLFSLCCISTYAQTPSVADKYNVEIVRDSFGVPHIFGKTDADVAFGLVWAACEDDFTTVQWGLLISKGMLGRHMGIDGAKIDYAVQLLRVRQIIEERYETDISPEFKKLLQAAADAGNLYAERHPDQVLVKKSMPVKPQDFISGYMLSMALMTGIDGALNTVVNKQVPEVPLSEQGRGSNGNILTKFPVRKVDLIEKGKSSIGGMKIWFDQKFGRLVNEEKDKSYYLGEFNTGDQVLVVYKDGNVELTNFELTNKYDMDDIYTVEKFYPEKAYSAVYYDGDNKNYYVKRFRIELKSEKFKSPIITEHKDSKLSVFSSRKEVWVKYNVVKGKNKEKVEEEANVSALIDVKGWKALGNRLTQNDVTGKITEVIKAEELPDEVEMGTTIELSVSPSASKKGNQGGLF